MKKGLTELALEQYESTAAFPLTTIFFLAPYVDGG